MAREPEPFDEEGGATWPLMDEAARRLGAPSAKAFLAVASPSMMHAFKLICGLIGRHEWAKQ